MLYAEITRAGRGPALLLLSSDVAVGESDRLAVLEVSGRPGVWRIWVDGQPPSGLIAARGSYYLWKPIATAETWNGGSSSCNRFAFRFRGVAVALSPRRLWRMLGVWVHVPRPGHVVRPLRPSPGPPGGRGEKPSRTPRRALRLATDGCSRCPRGEPRSTGDRAEEGLTIQPRSGGANDRPGRRPALAPRPRP